MHAEVAGDGVEASQGRPEVVGARPMLRAARGKADEGAPVASHAKGA